MCCTDSAVFRAGVVGPGQNAHSVENTTTFCTPSSSFLLLLFTSVMCGFHHSTGDQPTGSGRQLVRSSRAQVPPSTRQRRSIKVTSLWAPGPPPPSPVQPGVTAPITSGADPRSCPSVHSVYRLSMCCSRDGQDADAVRADERLDAVAASLPRGVVKVAVVVGHHARSAVAVEGAHHLGVGHDARPGLQLAVHRNVVVVQLPPRDGDTVVVRAAGVAAALSVSAFCATPSAGGGRFIRLAGRKRRAHLWYPLLRASRLSHGRSQEMKLDTVCESETRQTSLSLALAGAAAAPRRHAAAPSYAQVLPAIGTASSSFRMIVCSNSWW